MKQLRHILLLLPLLSLLGCQDDQLLEDAATHPCGTVNYRFMASIGEEIPETRVSLDPDSHGHGEEHLHNLALHWEEGDVVELTPADDATRHYTFTAVKYIYDTATGQFVSTPSETTRDMFIFESTDTDIPNPFTGTAVYKASRYPMPDSTQELKEMNSDGTIEIRNSPVFTQSSDGDTNHLKCCQTMSATLTNVDLKLGANEWATISDIKHPIIFETDGEYAYLKVEVNGFKYPIYGGGRVWIYDMDETTPIDDNLDQPEYETPLMILSFGISGSLAPYFDVPEYNSSSSTNFDSETEYYLGNEYVGTFYIPVKKYAIKGRHYIATVLQCGKYGDLYVWEKRVEQDMTFEAGKLYTLDYTDRAPEFAVKFGTNTYVRSKFLEQSADGTTAPYYNLKGEKVTLGGTSQYSNRFAYASGGSKWLSASDVSLMRKNHGAYVHVGTPSAAIYPNKKLIKWQMASNPDDPFPTESSSSSWFCLQAYKTDNTIWSIDHTQYYDDATSTDLYRFGSDGETESQGFFSKYLDTDAIAAPSIHYKTATYSYMQKIAKGVINPESDKTIGRAYLNCIEYVLQDRFDPVMHSSVTSKLWRAPYGTNLMCLSFSTTQFYFLPNATNPKKIKLVAPISGHCICLPYLKAYTNSVGRRGSSFDGEPTGSTTNNLGTWIEYNKIDQIFGCRSVRSFGSGTPAYMQGIYIGPTNKVSLYGNQYSIGFTQKFDIALPVLPVFRWKPNKSTTDNYFLPWNEITTP